MNAEANADHRQGFLLYVPQDLEICSVAFGIKLTQTGVRDCSVVFRVDIGRASGKKNAVHPGDVFPDDFAIPGSGYHQRQAARPEDRIEVMPDLADVLRFYVIASRNSDPGFVHN